jgi:PAS domain S-box-containing protein
VTDLNALFRGVFDAAPDAVIIADAEGRIVLANSQCAAVFDYAPDQLVGQRVEVLVPERFTAAHPSRRSGFFQARHPRPMGLLRLAAARRDGTEFPAEISLAPIEADGRHYVSATVRDITPRIREEERFRNLLEAAPDAMVIVDASGSVVLANNRVQDVLGYDRAALIGKPVTVLAPETERKAILALFRTYLPTPSTIPVGLTRELRARHRDGRVLPAEVALAPLETAEGVLVSVAVRDMTERRRIEQESQRLRDELIATVSHELRTPLTSIIGYAELLSDLDETDLSRRARKLLAVIDRNAKRELTLVDDLLTLAFVTDNGLRINPAPVDLADVGRGVVDDQALQARERGLELTFVDGPVRQVVGDHRRLVQVLGNLVTNALKFTNPGGRVEVRVHDVGSDGVLEVRDTGVGLTPEERAKVFDRLYRAPGAVAAQTQGAGLGLAIVRAIIEAHGGWIDLESQVGVGTVVRVGIPHAD